MKRIILVALIALSLTAYTSILLAGSLKTVTLKVEGMTCWLCPRAVKKAISKVDGVRTVRVNFKEEEAHVEYEEDKASIRKMIKAVEDAGYKASEIKEE